MADSKEFERIFDVSRETLEKLEAYEALLRKWTSRINLVSKSTLDDVWTRHFIDSAQVSREINQDAPKIADFGSGGGFPGLVLAILNSEWRPDSHVSLIESDVRKASFLSTVIRELDLNAKAIAERIEAVAPLSANIVTARALAPLEALLPMADQHLAKNGTALFLKGARYQEEVDAARLAWEFDLEIRASLSHPDAALLRITNLRSKS